jgi:hypothetical protein
MSSLYVASYDSQGYDGSILTRLHSGNCQITTAQTIMCPRERKHSCNGSDVSYAVRTEVLQPGPVLIREFPGFIRYELLLLEAGS